MLGLTAIPADAHKLKGWPQISYSKAVPGRYCKQAHHHKHTHTKKYGVLKCAKKGSAWRWTR